jgi:hypothetical protein
MYAGAVSPSITQMRVSTMKRADRAGGERINGGRGHGVEGVSLAGKGRGYTRFSLSAFATAPLREWTWSFV